MEYLLNGNGYHVITKIKRNKPLWFLQWFIPLYLQQRKITLSSIIVADNIHITVKEELTYSNGKVYTITVMSHMFKNTNGVIIDVGDRIVTARPATNEQDMLAVSLTPAEIMESNTPFPITGWIQNEWSVMLNVTNSRFSLPKYLHVRLTILNPLELRVTLKGNNGVIHAQGYSIEISKASSFILNTDVNGKLQLMLYNNDDDDDGFKAEYKYIPYTGIFT